MANLGNGRIINFPDTTSSALVTEVKPQLGAIKYDYGYPTRLDLVNTVVTLTGGKQYQDLMSKQEYLVNEVFQSGFYIVNTNATLDIQNTLWGTNLWLTRD